MSQRVYRSPWGTRPVEEKNVFDFVFANPNRVPDDKVALVLGATGEKVTYGELRDGARKMAHGLRHKLKLEPGLVLCVFSPNSIEYHRILFAAECAGIVISPANYAYSSHELAHQLRESGSRAILVHPTLLETAKAAAKEAGWSEQQIKDNFVFAARKRDAPSGAYRTLDDLLDSPPLESETIRDPKEQLAFLCFSSGTTSAAKGVMTTVSNMNSVLSLLDPFKPKASDVIVAALPFSHIYGLTKLVHWPIWQGMTIVIMPKFELQPFCKLVQQHRATIALLVPPVILLLAREKLVDDYDWSSLRMIISGAAPLGANLEEELEKRIKVPVRQAYGLTETSPTTHLCPIEEVRRGSIGFLLPNVDGRLVDPATGKDAEEGKEGEIWLRGPSIMKGYLNRPKETAETLVEGNWLRTGDVAYVKDNAFYISDRIKELIKYKGFQVPPAELEAVLISHPRVKDAAVIGIHSEKDATELPRAYVVAADPVAARKDAKAFEKDIQDFVAKKVAPHKRLRGGVAIVDEVYKSPSGKILRRMHKDEYMKKEAPAAKAKL